MAQLLEQMVTTGQAARRLEVSEERVRQLVKAGDLSAVKTPLGMLLDAGSVDELAERRQQARGKAVS